LTPIHPTPTTFDDPESKNRNSLKVGRLSAEVLLEYCISNHVLTTFHHRLTSRFFASVASQLPKISADKPNKAKNEPGTHHSSPQTPKTRFTHSKVVGPQLLTYSALG
jgi:hypothetical protein